VERADAFCLKSEFGWIYIWRILPKQLH
jgi:hypothetical protein